MKLQLVNWLLFVTCMTPVVMQAQTTSIKETQSRWEFSGGITAVFISDGQHNGTVQRSYTWQDAQGNEFFEWLTTDAYGITANIRFRPVANLGISLGYEYLFRNHEIDGGSFDSETGLLKVFPTQGKFLSFWAKTSSIPITLDYRFYLADGKLFKGSYFTPYVALGVDQYEHNRFLRDDGIRYRQGGDLQVVAPDALNTHFTSVDGELVTTFSSRAVWYPSLRFGGRFARDFGKWGIWELDLGYRANPSGRSLEANDIELNFEHIQYAPYGTVGTRTSDDEIRRINGSYNFPLYIGGITTSLRWVKPLGKRK